MHCPSGASQYILVPPHGLRLIDHVIDVAMHSHSILVPIRVSISSPWTLPFQNDGDYGASFATKLITRLRVWEAYTRLLPIISMGIAFLFKP